MKGMPAKALFSFCPAFREPTKMKISRKCCVLTGTGYCACPSAKDFLYKKSEQSAFIDLDPPKKNERKVISTPDGEYEFSSQISPIFGVIKENDYKVNTKSDPDTKIVNKPDSSHLEIITSPIYGYAKQNDAQYNYNEYFEDTSEQELHELLDDDFQDDHTYDDFADDEEINLFNYRED